MSSRTSRGLAYERLREFDRKIIKRAIMTDPPFVCKACEDIDSACEGDLDSDIALQDTAYDEFPDRQRVEQNLLHKVDLRMSILVLIYILNYVSQVCTY
jgi:hypothetical protein